MLARTFDSPTMIAANFGDPTMATMNFGKPTVAITNFQRPHGGHQDRAQTLQWLPPLWSVNCKKKFIYFVEHTLIFFYFSKTLLKLLPNEF
jgi:hypothetical protein